LDLAIGKIFMKEIYRKYKERQQTEMFVSYDNNSNRYTRTILEDDYQKKLEVLFKPPQFRSPHISRFIQSEKNINQLKFIISHNNGLEKIHIQPNGKLEDIFINAGGKSSYGFQKNILFQSPETIDNVAHYIIKKLQEDGAPDEIITSCQELFKCNEYYCSDESKKNLLIWGYIRMLNQEIYTNIPNELPKIITKYWSPHIDVPQNMLSFRLNNTEEQQIEVERDEDHGVPDGFHEVDEEEKEENQENNQISSNSKRLIIVGGILVMAVIFFAYKKNRTQQNNIVNQNEQPPSSMQPR